MRTNNVQGAQLPVSIVLLNSDAVVCCLCILPWGASSRGRVIVRFVLFSIRRVLLFCSYSVHNRRADVIGRYDICEGFL